LNNVGHQTVMDPIYFHSIFFPYYGSQWGPSTFFKISSFVFSRRKKWTYLEKLEGEEISIFG